MHQFPSLSFKISSLSQKQKWPLFICLFGFYLFIFNLANQQLYLINNKNNLVDIGMKRVALETGLQFCFHCNHSGEERQDNKPLCASVSFRHRKQWWKDNGTLGNQIHYKVSTLTLKFVRHYQQCSCIKNLANIKSYGRQYL